MRNECTITEEHTPPRDSLRVLVVDDDPFMCALLTRQFRDAGVTEAVSLPGGAEAIQACLRSDRCPDLVVLDLNMPEVDGADVLRALGAGAFSGDLLLLSGEDPGTLRASRMLASNYGLSIVGLKTKPLSRDDIREVLGERRMRAPRDSQSGHRAFSPVDLARAIERRELTLHFQPQVLIDDGRVCGVEALVRWPQPNGTIAPPDRFLSLASSSGLMLSLTRLVVEAGLKQAAAWRRDGLQLNLALNVTMGDLIDPSLSQELIRLTKELHVPPETVSVEVTESEVMGEETRILDALIRLRMNRFRLSLDDFGTGHSVFPHLRDLPVDELKIDKAFTNGAHGDNRLAAFVRSTVNLARDLGVTSVAEGVETAADWKYLRDAGATCAQGYFVGAPMPAESLPQWMGEWYGRVRKEQLCAASVPARSREHGLAR